MLPQVTPAGICKNKGKGNTAGTKKGKFINLFFAHLFNSGKYPNFRAEFEFILLFTV